jgi:hypothetical protein
MNGYEYFDLRTWLVDGLLTRHLKVTTSKRRGSAGGEVRGPGRVGLSVSAFAVSTLLSTVSLESLMQTPSIVPSAIFDAQAVRTPDEISGSPAAYWAAVSAEINSWEPIKAVSLADVPPFV